MEVLPFSLVVLTQVQLPQTSDSHQTYATTWPMPGFLY